MSNYINGVSYPAILVLSADGTNIIEEIELDLCGEGGLVEEYEEDFKRNKLESGRIIDFDFKGSNIIFTLDYSEYVKKSLMFKIEKIYAYHSQPLLYKLILIPRADVQARSFEVRLEDGRFSMGVLKGGVNAKGNRLPVIKFVTLNPQSKNFMDSDNLQIRSQYKVKF